MKHNINNEESIKCFWKDFNGHISFLEEKVRAGDTQAFQKRYSAVNIEAQMFHPMLRVEFALDLMAGKVTSITLTSQHKKLGRDEAKLLVSNCPEELQSMVTLYRLPVLEWENEVTLSWLTDMCGQYGLKSVASDIGKCLAAARVAVKRNAETGHVLIQIGFRNKKEIRAVDTDLVFLMLELLLGEEIITEAVDALLIKTSKELPSKKAGWSLTTGLECRDVILKVLLGG